MVKAAGALMCLSASPASANPAPSRPVTKPASDCPMPPNSAGGLSNAETRHIENGLTPSLADRMRALKVPGVGVALIRGGRLVWARGWGVRDAGTCEPVTPDTIFQAASISKPVAALLALRLVEQRRLDLDGDINGHLRRWRLPGDPRFAPGHVTLRQLLSHTGGVGVSGFQGYARGTPLPSLAQMLDGRSPANHPAVRLEAKPGAESSYSGGGYMIVQTAIEDATRRSFADLARREIFAPLGMEHSGFAQPSGRRAGNMASGHDGGDPFRDKFRVHPELAAAGLWTTPADLARLMISTWSATWEAGHIVSPDTAAMMLTPVANGRRGLGFSLRSKGGERWFGHDGRNWGFQSVAWMNQATGDGIVMMTNGEGGMALVEEVATVALPSE